MVGEGSCGKCENLVHLGAKDSISGKSKASFLWNGNIIACGPVKHSAFRHVAFLHTWSHLESLLYRSRNPSSFWWKKILHRGAPGHCMWSAAQLAQYKDSVL